MKSQVERQCVCYLKRGKKSFLFVFPVQVTRVRNGKRIQSRGSTRSLLCFVLKLFKRYFSCTS